MNTRFAGVVFAFLLLVILATLPLRPGGHKTMSIAQADVGTTSADRFQAAPSDSISSLTVATLILGAAAIGQAFFRPHRRAVRAHTLSANALLCDTAGCTQTA